MRHMEYPCRHPAESIRSVAIMKGFENLTAHLQSFEANRKASVFPSADEREAYANAIADCFMPCARAILSGHFVVVDSDRKAIREIFPTAIELYYHEEKEGGFKDPIMYHTNDRKKTDGTSYFATREIDKVPYFPIGSMNPHTSGIDITFENPEEQYRASFLIREYSISFNGGPLIPIKNSTDIYDDMLIYGITFGDADWIEWVDGKSLDTLNVVRGWRRNVAKYEEKTPGVWGKKEVPQGRNSFTIGKYTYEKCPFDWQFRSIPQK